MAVIIKQRSPRAEEAASGILMGLEKAGMVLFPNCTTEFEIPFVNNRYQLGLDDSPELKAEFEKHFNVKFDTREGLDFLDSYTIRLNHDVQSRDYKHIEHKFDMHILKVNKGMGYVAFSNDDLEENGFFPFIVADDQRDMEQRVSQKALKVKAFAELDKLSTKEKRMIQVAEYIFDLNVRITPALAFDRLSDLVQTTTGAAKFSETLKLDPEYIDTVITVKRAMNRNIIRLSKDQWYVNYANQTKLGRNMDEVVKYLSNPQNQDQLGFGKDDDQPYSIRRQLKEAID
jgi:hypothetical protein